MAKKNVEAAAAAKARKQKIILIVGGVLLLGLGAIQGPKMFGGGGAAEATPAPTATTGVATGTPTAAPTTPAPTTASFKPAGTVAGVALPGVTVAKGSAGQLASFTLFEVKDPFVQQAGEEPAAGDVGGAPAPETSVTAPVPTASGGAAGTPPAAAPPPLVYATINVDGKPSQMKVKEEFPASEPVFVLVSVGKKQAKIGVAGGSFDNGKTITLKPGKKLTLVNTATNVRYVLKLVYTGSDPESIEGFSASTDTTKSQAGTDASASSTVSVAPAGTP